jgi:hypothetical protein
LKLLQPFPSLEIFDKKRRRRNFVKSWQLPYKKFGVWGDKHMCAQAPTHADPKLHIYSIGQGMGWGEENK